MELICEHCGEIYEDVERLTYCPHAMLMSPANLAQKDAGIALLGRPVCFAHKPDGPWHRVQAVSWNGMVTLADMAGEFAPHLFVAADED